MVKMAQIKAAIGTATLLSTLAIVAPPAQAGWFTDWFNANKTPENAYKLCGERLDKAGIAKDVASTACAEVLHPEYVSQCVMDISAKQVDALATLAACRRVRRPLALSTCVTDIHQQDAVAALPTVMEACRLSLLPERYGKCVVGLNQSLAIATLAGLTQCLDASDRPTDVLSTFIPIDNLPRMDGFGTTAGAAESNLLQTSPNPTVPATTTAPADMTVPPGTPQLY
ncbi:MAG: hypothetical protein HC805_01055 [Alkalinema sp. RL_2_19]|nr:hypothetical protein [Alkalinema sp. RL_2_19]